MTAKETELRDRLSEIEKELEGITRACEGDGEEERSAEDLQARATALLDEKKSLEEELAAEEQRKQEVAASISAGTGKVVKRFGGDEMGTEKLPGIDSREYRDAWLKSISGRKLSDYEERVLATGITGNTEGEGTDVTGQHITVPTELLENIWNLIEETHPFLNDVTIYRTGTVIEVLRHTASTGASIVAEGAAPDEEENTFDKIVLAGKDFAKYIDITYAMERMSIDALASYLTREIAERMGAKMANDAIATAIDGIENDEITGIDYEKICQAFGALKRTQGIVVYATRETIYGKIIALTDDVGRPIYQADPTGKAIGYVLGAQIKQEDGIPEGKLLIGDPKRFTYNMVQDIMIESDRDIKKHVTTYSGYARGEGALIDTESMVVMDGSGDGGSGN